MYTHHLYMWQKIHLSDDGTNTHTLFNNVVRADKESVHSFVLRLEKYAEKVLPGGAEKMTVQKIKEFMISDRINNISFSTLSEASLTFTALEEMKYS